MNTRESDFWNERSGPRIAPEHFGEIVATAADIALVVGSGGSILSTTTNPLNSAIGSIAHWEGRPIQEFLAPDSAAKVERRIAQTLARADEAGMPIEVNHVDGANWDFPVRYTMHETGRDGRVLMLGRDLRPLSELQQRLVRAQVALERDHERQRVFETRYRVLLESVSEAIVLVDVSSGRVLDLNGPAAHRLGDTREALTGAAFTQEFENRRRGEFIDALCQAAQADDGRLAVTLRGGERQVELRPVLFRNAGERILLCFVDGPDAPIDAASAIWPPAFFDAAREGIVLTDGEGRIERVNDTFLSMMDTDSAGDLRGRPIADLLARGSIDLKVLREGGQAAPLATQLTTRYGSRVPVEVTLAELERGRMALVLREGDGAGPLGDADGDGDASGGSDAARAMALVGSAPLRDIVASMTDVIEKKCIEAAIELTDNNRVAASEMLGLSRQSLYVKLRKYGLLNRDES